ncbi:DUF4305 domain-containing protein [Pisciglobus halotolerans]|uniref:DUF4305 domain-containing protein n=1 Tax=Pisciglobus halotolerans TaxID=745365 RepID=A0A1I3CN07_9LACT|nr:DUF4305 domain-containing protein [Pisciglobus halotolerans]SFH75629.1 protein of unknown function [Pisciglobus halotolerans]
MIRKKDFIFQILFNFIFSAIFIWFAIDYVGSSGWGIFPVIFIFFATNDVVRGIKIIKLYQQVKKGNKP